MLGFSPISSGPLSDAILNPITGSISATDDNDTATINATELDNGVISTTDSNDTAALNGTVTDVTISGTISATDGTDTAAITANNGVATVDTHDGFTKAEIRRAKLLDKKIREAEQRRIEANKAQAANRKNTIKELVDPSPKVKKNKVESNQQVSEDIPLEVTNYDAVIANLERQRQELFHAVALRMEISRIQTELAIMKAKQEAELDDEEALLLLL